MQQFIFHSNKKKKIMTYSKIQFLYKLQTILNFLKLLKIINFQFLKILKF